MQKPNKIKEYIGKTFNELTILEINGDKNKHGQSICLAKCSCGKTKDILVGSIITGNTKTCGHTLHKAIDESIKKYGRLEIIKFIPHEPQDKRMVLVECECGKRFECRLESLRQGNTSSCGCAESTNHKAFDENSPRSLYWAGFIGADGCLIDNKIFITIHEKDRVHLSHFAMLCKNTEDLIRFNRHPHVGVVIYSDRISDKLREYGITERKSLTFTPSDKCSDSVDFWRGMIDGDGSLYWHKMKSPVLRLCGSYESCIKFAQWVSKITGQTHNLSKNVNIFQCSIYGKNAIKVASALYGNHPEYFMHRKYLMYLSFLYNKPTKNI